MAVAFDPDNDGLAEFSAGSPAFAVENVLLQQREERLHGGVVVAGAHSPHRAEPPDALISIEGLATSRHNRA